MEQSSANKSTAAQQERTPFLKAGKAFVYIGGGNRLL